MTFQIVRISPTYHCSTDAIIGSQAHRLPMSYNSEALAHKLAGILTDRDYNACGDDYFVVVPFGESPFTARRHQAIPTFDDMPF